MDRNPRNVDKDPKARLWNLCLNMESHRGTRQLEPPVEGSFGESDMPPALGTPHLPSAYEPPAPCKNVTLHVMPVWAQGLHRMRKFLFTCRKLACLSATMRYVHDIQQHSYVLLGCLLVAASLEPGQHSTNIYRMKEVSPTPTAHIIIFQF